MGMQIAIWNDDQTKKEIEKRYRNAAESRIYQEERWIRNERTCFATSSTQNMSYLQTSLESNFNIGLPGVDGSNAEMNVAYSFKNLRFIHAQMSSNPPSVVMRPNTSDQDDHRKADAADRVVRWAIRHYQMQEKVDQQTLHTLLYGTGILKSVWDSTRGDIVDFDQDSGEMTLEGDIDISVPFIWNLFLDPDAKATDELRWIIERIYMDYEEACTRWPDKIEFLKKARVEKRAAPYNGGRDSQLQNDHYNCVELLEYWETGLPTNGYLGRYCMTTTEGDVVEPCRPNPFRFTGAGTISRIENSDLPDEVKAAKLKKVAQKARLPYHILTDIDVPNMVWGRAFVEYTAQLQENLNRLDSAVLDNIQAHGAARIVLPESAEISDDGLSNSPWDVVKITGSQPPFFMAPPQLMPEMTPVRQNIIQGINDVSGVNESMLGQQSREQSGASMQYATNQGNTIRRRLFNKYVLDVETIYQAILDLVRKHWTTGRTISVLGKEKALESIDLRGADIDGGYNVVGEYGVSLSLDPITRRQEVISMQPLFEKAGVPPRTTLRMMKLSELESLYDSLDRAGDRQKEIFDEMIATGQYLKPKKYRDHENMIAWALDYFMTSEYENLPLDKQALCERHIEERSQVAAQERAGGASASPAANTPPSAPGPAPQQGPIPNPVGQPAMQTGASASPAPVTPIQNPGV